MKTNFSLLLLLLLTFNGLTQTFAVKHGKRKRTCTIAQKYTDSIRLDVYTLEPDFTKFESTHLLMKSSDEVQILDSKKSHYGTNKIIANQTGDFLWVSLLDTTNGKEKHELKLFPVDPNLSSTLKKGDYYSHKSKQLELLEDSLSCAMNNESIALLFNDDRVAYDSVSYAEYTKSVNFIGDSLMHDFILKSEPVTGPYYRAIRNMTGTNSDMLIQLLDSADFSYTYAKRFLNAIACEQPNALIQYVDLKKTNEKNVLKAIRRHDNYKEIIAHIKAASKEETYGKTKILKQEKKRENKRIWQVLTVVGQVTLTIGALLLIL